MINRPDWGDGSGRSSGVAESSAPSVPAVIDLDTVKPGTVIDGATMLRSQEEAARRTPAVRDDRAEWRDPEIPQHRDPETGQYRRLTPLDRLRDSWEKEGGYDFNLKQAQGNATRVLERMPDADDFKDRFDTLPATIQQKVFDVLRLSPSRSTTAASLLSLIESSLTPEELVFADMWTKSLSPEQRNAIMAGLGGKRR